MYAVINKINNIEIQCVAFDNEPDAILIRDMLREKNKRNKYFVKWIKF